MTWTQFMDMHSGGGVKEGYDHIYIELPKKEAIDHFEARFGHHPDHVTCDCCGEDYYVSQYETLEEATALERGQSSWSRGPITPLAQYITESGNSAGKAFFISEEMLEKAP